MNVPAMTSASGGTVQQLRQSYVIRGSLTQFPLAASGAQTLPILTPRTHLNNYSVGVFSFLSQLGGSSDS